MRLSGLAGNRFRMVERSRFQTFPARLLPGLDHRSGVWATLFLFFGPWIPSEEPFHPMLLELALQVVMAAAGLAIASTYSHPASSG
jgi:hypothetical protein